MAETQSDGVAEVTTEAAVETERKPIEMTKAMAGRRGLKLTTVAEMMRFAEVVAASSMAPTGCRGKPNDCFLCIQGGAELGFNAVQALQSMFVVNGRAKVYGDGMWALCLASPLFDNAAYDEHFEGEGEELTAHCTLRRKVPGAKPHKRTFSLADAKRAGLAVSDTYKKYLRDMLIRRARSRCCGDVFADLLKGMGSAETQAEVEASIAALDLADAPEREGMTVAERMVFDAKAEEATATTDAPPTRKHAATAWVIGDAVEAVSAEATDTPPVLKEPDVPTEAIAAASAPETGIGPFRSSPARLETSIPGHVRPEPPAAAEPEPTTPELQDEKQLTATRKKIMEHYMKMKPEVAKECLKNSGLDRITQIGDLTGSDLQAVLDMAISLT